MLAELVDAVVGVDTHRDSHEVEIALPTGIAIGTRKISNDDSGFAELLAWIVELTVVTTAQVNRLRALLLGGDDAERSLARATLTDPVLVAMARRRPSPQASRDQAVRHSEIRRLARAVRAGRRALLANRDQLQTIVEEMAPGLTERRGIGAVTAAQVIVSFSHPGRCRNDAAFAALSGTSPLPASSGQTVRHRLNRGGDRALNRAIHLIALTRMRSCPTTKQYIARRRAEGKSSREIQRCLKRYIARELFRTLNTNTKLAAPTTALAA